MHGKMCIGGMHELQVARGESTEEELKARQAKGMADPEVQRILTDPIMRQVRDVIAMCPVCSAEPLTRCTHPGELQWLVPELCC